MKVPKMNTEETVLKELLKMKASLLAKLNAGTLVVHPQDVIEELNKIIKIIGD